MNAFQLVFVFLAVSVLAVPIATRFGLGSVLGYLIAGAVIGPHGFKLVGEVSEQLQNVADFGVVMMLFLIGLELRPSVLRELRRSIFGLGTAQVLGTAIAIGSVAMLFGVGWKPALSIGLILAMSSTAIVLQSLAEKGLLHTPGGQATFAILLFQDIAVIPIITILPLLAERAERAAEAANPGAIIYTLPPWAQPLVIFVVVGILVFAGRYLLRPFFRYVARTGLREMFTAAALLLVFAVVALMHKTGLSPALGSFLAGVLLAESEYRVQLETDIEPFKGLLLGLFFISVGASIDFPMIAREPGKVAAFLCGMLLAKFLVLLAVGRFAKFDWKQSLLLALALAQGGEFAFVLFSSAAAHNVLPTELTHLLTATVALSMALSPLLFVLYRKISRRFETRLAERVPDQIDEHDNPVILAGFGRFGHVIGRLLRANGFPTTVLDHDPDQVDALRKFGLKSFYGDASRLDLLRAAGADRAKLFVVAIEDEARTKHIVSLLQKNFPNLRIMARAISRQHAYELLRMGVTDVFRETFGSALDLGRTALIRLGMEKHRAHRAAEIFYEHDEASVRAMATLDAADEAYLSTARLHNENLLRALQSDEKMLRR